ncbi:MAG TPA: hypothetical protein ENI61_02090, partial [Ignavibacteria bacterium]|nr:hypothetical protein [Ignavibacteria bacterium]
MLIKNILIDGNNLIHRSNAVFVKNRIENDIILSSKGYPTGLIYGIFSMLSSWISEIHSPNNIIFFLDGKPVRRLSIDPTYKQKQGEKIELPGSANNQIT